MTDSSGSLRPSYEAFHAFREGILPPPGLILGRKLRGRRQISTTEIPGTSGRSGAMTLVLRFSREVVVALRDNTGNCSHQAGKGILHLELRGETGLRDKVGTHVLPYRAGLSGEILQLQQGVKDPLPQAGWGLA